MREVVVQILLRTLPLKNGKKNVRGGVNLNRLTCLT